MLKWWLVVTSVIGIWYGLPGIWSGISQPVHSTIHLAGWTPLWIHLLTLVTVWAAFKVKGK